MDAKLEALRLVGSHKSMAARKLLHAIEREGMKAKLVTFGNVEASATPHPNLFRADVRVIVPCTGKSMLTMFGNWAVLNWPLRGDFIIHLSGPRRVGFHGRWTDSLFTRLRTMSKGLADFQIGIHRVVSYYSLLGPWPPPLVYPEWTVNEPDCGPLQLETTCADAARMLNIELVEPKKYLC